MPKVWNWKSRVLLVNASLSLIFGLNLTPEFSADAERSNIFARITVFVCRPEVKEHRHWSLSLP